MRGFVGEPSSFDPLILMPGRASRNRGMSGNLTGRGTHLKFAFSALTADSLSTTGHASPDYADCVACAVTVTTGR